MILIDPPVWPGRGRLWSHLVSDTSLEELHAFARALGAPPRGFDRDHYDVPAERYEAAIRLGARPASSREIVAALHGAGLRRRKHLHGGTPVAPAPAVAPQRAAAEAPAAARQDPALR